MSNPPANPHDAQRLFEAFLSARGRRLESLVPREGIDALLDFFRAQRFEFRGVDWVLFQYGTYDRGYGTDTVKGRFFYVDFTRQLAFDQDFDEGDDDEDEDDEHGGIRQLSLTFLYPAAPEFDALRSDHRWCQSHAPDAIAEFEAFVRTSAPFVALADARAVTVELDYESSC